MVNIFFTVVSLAVLVVAMVTKNTTTGSLPSEPKTEVLSATSQVTSAPIETLTPTPSVAPLATVSPVATVSATPAPTLSPRPSATPVVLPITEWIYPGPVSDTSTSDSAVSFTTIATPKEVTLWYKTKLKSRFFTINQDIESVANKQGVPLKTLNKLVAVHAETTLVIEISDESPEAPVNVTVTQSQSLNSI